MSTLTLFIVLESPNPALAAVGDELTLEEAAQLAEADAKEMFTQAYLAAELRYFGFRFRIRRDPDLSTTEMTPVIFL